MPEEVNVIESQNIDKPVENKPALNNADSDNFDNFDDQITDNVIENQNNVVENQNVPDPSVGQDDKFLDLNNKFLELNNKYQKLLEANSVQANHQQQAQQQQQIQYEEEIVPENPSMMSAKELSDYVNVARRNTAKLIYGNVSPSIQQLNAVVASLANEITALKAVVNSGVKSSELDQLNVIIKENGLGSTKNPYNVARIILANKNVSRGKSGGRNRRPTEFGTGGRSGRTDFKNSNDKKLSAREKSKLIYEEIINKKE